MEQDEPEPGPSSAIQIQPTRPGTTTHQSPLRESPPPASPGTSASAMKPTKSKTPNYTVITEMKQIRPGSHSSSATTPSPTSSFAIEDSKKVVYSIFPPLHDTVVFGLTKRQLLTLVTLALTEFFCGQIYSIQSPFFPEMASHKLLPTYVYGQIGCIFGIFELSVFIFIPLFGKMMQNNGTQPKLLFHLGVFVVAISTILFSLVELIPTPKLFLIASLSIRLVQGFGEAAILSSSCALLTIEFSNAIATTFTSMETFYALGIVSGPVVGGALMNVYEIDESGKFMLTFLVIGSILLGVGVVDLFLLPTSDNHESLYELDGKCCFNNGGFKVFHLFRAPSIALVALTILGAGASFGFINVVLEPHIREFLIGKSYMLIGGFFILMGGLCGLLSPGFNWLTEKLKGSSRFFAVVGSLLIVSAFMLIAPNDIIPIEKSLIWVGLGLALEGIGLASLTVSSFKLLMREAINDGYANNINTYGLTLTFWTLTFSFGSFVGSCASGFLYDTVEISTGSWFIIGLHLLLILFNTLSILVAWRTGSLQKARKSIVDESREDQPLLASDSFYGASSKHKSYS